MVNLTYGLMQQTTSTTLDGGAGVLITTNGTDIIATNSAGTVSVYDPGDIAWVLTCTALVWIMIPGLGYLYSGLARRKNAAHMLLLTLLCMATISIQWWLWGFSLAFSPTSGSFFGNLNKGAFDGVLDDAAAGANNKIPMIVYAIYEQMFAALVPAIAIGAAAERGRIAPVVPFLFCWATLVYCPLACWVWNPTGWAFKWQVYDYAGGVPVEICSGVTGLVYSLFIGRRRGFGTDRLAYKPHSVSHVFIGTTFLWFGWLGFNGGSTFAANIKAALAIANTNLCASVAGLTWMVMDFRFERKWSPVGFCTGAIAGLVAITPAAGYVGLPAAALIGFVAAVISNVATGLKTLLKFDDAMDLFAVHAIAGATGVLMTGLFAQSSVAANDGFLVVPGGWLDHHYVQLAKQLAWVAVGTGWTALVTFLIMFVINLIPGLQFRASTEGEIVGMDEDQCGEFAYDFAYLNRDLEGNYVNPESSSEETNGNGVANGEKGYKGTGTNADIENGAKTDVRGAAIPGQTTFQGPDHPSGDDATSAQTHAWARERNLGAQA